MPFNSFDDYPMNWRPDRESLGKPYYVGLVDLLEESVRAGELSRRRSTAAAARAGRLPRPEPLHGGARLCARARARARVRRDGQGDVRGAARAKRPHHHRRRRGRPRRAGHGHGLQPVRRPGGRRRADGGAARLPVEAHGLFEPLRLSAPPGGGTPVAGVEGPSARARLRGGDVGRTERARGDPMRAVPRGRPHRRGRVHVRELHRAGEDDGHRASFPSPEMRTACATPRSTRSAVPWT